MTTGKSVCLVTPILFRPHEADWDVVCIGVAVTCPERRQFEFCLGEDQPAVRTRMEHDFRDVSPLALRFAADCVRTELAIRVSDKDWLQRLRHLFVRKREGLVRYGNTQALLADDAGEVLRAAFARYVLRETAEPAPAPLR